MYIPLTFEGALQKCLFASGGYEGYFISGSTQYKYHWFTGSADLVVQKGSIDNVQLYVIGGGGGGARGTENTTPAGGGGGGGVSTSYNTRLFGGTYTVTVGKGGTGASIANSDGGSGSLSSFVGSNITLIAQGGGGGSWGNTGRGGTSGNGLLGGGNSSVVGGGGGGATAVGASGSAGGDGGAGEIINAITASNAGYGCGGGGYNSGPTGQSGYSCNGPVWGAGGDTAQPGADKFGMGGGGGGLNGGNGGSGSVIAIYPIYDYCSNFFNETGSCGCLQLTINRTIDGSSFRPNATGSYVYMPCGGTEFESGSIFYLAPLTVCVVSGSYFSFNRDTTNYTGFATSAYGVTKQCETQSLFPIACASESFAATCTSSIVTIHTPSASVGAPTQFYYVAKNATTHSRADITTQRVSYYCISTGSVIDGNPTYPQVITGNNITFYPTASCYNITITDGSGKRGIINNCNGTQQTLVSPANGTTYCIDGTLGVRAVSGFTLIGYSIGGDCIGTAFDTASCGCP